MGHDPIDKHRRKIAVAYCLMFLALPTGVMALFAYLLARHVAYAEQSEVWLQAHGLWIMRNIALSFLIGLFASLWFVPLLFVYWSSALWVTATTMVGIIFALIAWLFLLNAWLKGIGRFWGKRAVF